ncbi:MAG: hypothetical protein MJ185_01565 [Treponema sp.]|nr:hypothetical protein [Treponema sp.]
MRKKIFFCVSIFLITSLCVYSLDVVETANKEFLTLEETIKLAEKDEKKYTQMISDFKFLKNATEGHIQADFKEIDSVINKYPYMPCTEAVRFLLLPDNEVLNSANYIYSVFAGCPADNTMKDKIYLRILEASLKENNFHWSYNAARDLSDKAKETIVYKSFMTAISQN